MNTMKITVFAMACISMASAGVVLDIQVQNLMEKVPPRLEHVLVEKDRLRMWSENPQRDENHYFIYRDDQKAMYLLDPDKKSYVEITRADMERARARLNQAKAQMEEAMKNLPPDRRAAMEKMMQGRMGGDDQDSLDQLEFKKIGSGQVGSWNATEYAVYLNGKKASLAWVVPFSTLNIKREDFDVFKRVGLFSGVSKNRGFDRYFKLADKMGGWPVRSESLDSAGTPDSRMEVKLVKNQAIDASEFEVPAGYTKRSMGMAEGQEGKD